MCFGVWILRPTIIDSWDAKAQSVPANQEEDKALGDLHTIGRKIAKAVLAKDIEAILRYDRPDLVEADRKLLSNSKNDLYCYMLDTSCITWAEGERSVYDILSKAKQLTISVRDHGKSIAGYRHAMIYFFDGSAIDEVKLSSQDFLCKKGGKEIATWTFEYVYGKWQSTHPPFDAETDVHCPVEID